MAKKKGAQQFKEIDIKDTKSGMVVRVHQTIKDMNTKGEEKERIQVFEGLIIKRRGGMKQVPLLPSEKLLMESVLRKFSL